MRLMARIVRLGQAGIHGIIDRCEDPGLLLRQHLREMETAINHNGQRHAGAIRLRRRFQARRSQIDQGCAALDPELDAALRSGREPRARLLIARRQALVREQAEIESRLVTLDQKISTDEHKLEQQRRQYDGIRRRAASYRSHGQALPGADIAGRGTADDASSDAAAVEMELIGRKAALQERTK